MVFVHCCIFLFAYRAVVITDNFNAVKVCCKTVMTCVEPDKCHCLFSWFVFVVFPCGFDVMLLCFAGKCDGLLEEFF
jgi:hypothetical protein